MSKTIRLLMLLVVAFGLGTGQAKADGETKVNGVKYLDANGVELTKDDVTVLTGGGEATLAGGWYVVNSDITYTGKVTLSGDVHLILCDGAKMSVGSSKSRLSNIGIDGYGETSCDLTIYGQSTGDDKGTLSVYTTGVPNYIWNCIETINLTINGGHVIANADGDDAYALYISGNFTINGGTVEATATSGDAIYSTEFHYAGGTVTTTATSGYALYSWKYTFTWRNPTDQITIGSTGLFTDTYTTTTAKKRFVVYDDAEGTAASRIVSGTGGTDFKVRALAGKTLRPLAVSETVGGVTTAYPASCLSVPAGTVVSGKTEADGKTPKPDITIGGKPYYLFKNGDEVSFTLEDRGQDGVKVNGLPIDLLIMERVPTINFQMRTDDVDVTAQFYIKNTGVDYLDWDDTQKTLVPKNTKDLSPVPKVYMLDGTETYLDGGWYVAKGTLSYDHQFSFDNSDMYLILADGAEMTVTPTSAEDGIYSIYSLTIYGQSIDAATMGQLTVTATVPTTDDNFYSGIRTYGVTIHGGKVTATGSGEGILSMKKVSGNYYHGDITLCGGIVEAKGLHGLSAQNVWYYGGQVTALGEPSYPAVVASSNIRLDWTNSSDFFFADNYTGSIPTLASGSFFSVDGTIYGDKTVPYVFDGNEGRARWSVLLGKTLVPAMSFEMDKPFVVKTFEGNWKVSEGAKTFLPIGYDLSAGQVTLAEVKGAPDGLPVVIGPEDGQTLPATYFLVAAQGDEVKDIGDDYDDIAGDMSRRFAITDGTKTLAEVISGTGVDASEAVILVLANGKFTSVNVSAYDLEKKAKAGLLLLVLSKWEYMHIKPGAQSASDPLSTRAIGIGNGEATGIEAVLQTTPDPSLLRRGMAGALWYDLQGRRIAQPKQKGIYIRDGKKTVIK